MEHLFYFCDAPRGQAGRPSKSLTAAEAALGLDAADQDGTGMRAYVVVSLLTGGRTEELRALTWAHVDLGGNPPSVALWRSVRRTGDTKTRQSRRTLERRRARSKLWPRTECGRTSTVAPLGATGPACNWCSPHEDWDRAGRSERSPFVPPTAGHGRSGRCAVDAARATALVRVLAIERGDQLGGHFALGGPCEHAGN